MGSRRCHRPSMCPLTAVVATRHERTDLTLANNKHVCYLHVPPSAQSWGKTHALSALGRTTAGASVVDRLGMMDSTGHS